MTMQWHTRRLAPLAAALGLAAGLPAAARAATPPKAAPAKAAATARSTAPAVPGGVQALLDQGALRTAYNPVLVSFLTEEGRDRLPPKQRQDALDQLVAGFKQEIKPQKGAQAAAAAVELAGLLAGGSVGQALSEGANEYWSSQVAAAFVLQKAGFAAESSAFFESCLTTFPSESLRASCASGLALNDAEKAYTVLAAQLDAKGADEEVVNVALRVLGQMAGAPGFPADKKDKVYAELVKRTKGLATAESSMRAAVDGLALMHDPRAVEPLQSMTKGMLKSPEVKWAALRALAVTYKEPGAVEQLQKKLKGGFMSDPTDAVTAATILIEAGQQPGFDYALEYLSKKKKKDPDLSPDLVQALLAKGGLPSRAVLQKAIAAQKPGTWLAASMAIGLLEMGDASSIDVVKAALTNKDWLHTRMEAAVALAGQGDTSGLPVLQSLTEGQGLLKSAVDLAFGSYKDPEAMRTAVADALARTNRPEAVPILTRLLSDKSDRVRLAAAYALLRMTDPSTLDGLSAALSGDYGKENGGSRNPQVHAALLRAATLRLPQDARTADMLKRGADSPFVSVRFLALAAARSGR